MHVNVCVSARGCGVWGWGVGGCLLTSPSRTLRLWGPLSSPPQRDLCGRGRGGGGQEARRGRQQGPWGAAVVGLSDVRGQVRSGGGGSRLRAAETAPVAETQRQRGACRPDKWKTREASRSLPARDQLSSPSSGGEPAVGTCVLLATSIFGPGTPGPQPRVTEMGKARGCGCGTRAQPCP